MTKITEYFDTDEFKCKCGCETPPEVAMNLDHLVIVELHPVRVYLGLKMRIASGYRCVDYNRRVGGVRNSQHILGTAADIVVAGVPIKSLRDVLNVALKAHKYGPGGLGYYPKWHLNLAGGWGFLHVDLRDTNRAVRWTG